MFLYFLVIELFMVDSSTPFLVKGGRNRSDIAEEQMRDAFVGDKKGQDRV